MFENDEIKIRDTCGNLVVIEFFDSINLHLNDNFDCVTLSARYDHGFGFSQLFRFVDHKESKEIAVICDQANATLTPKLLPLHVSKKWRVLVTPVIKSNDAQNRNIYKQLMLSIINEVQNVAGTKILFSQYGLMLSHKAHHFDGIIEALVELKSRSFNEIRTISFEIDSRYKTRVRDQFANVLCS
jgi:hypothetical protein